MLLANKVALITGGAKGIGRSTALKYSEEGCSIVIADINIDEANKTLTQLKGKGENHLALKCDVTDSQQIKAVVDAVMRKYGKIDILLNNAGGMSSAPPLEEIDETAWDKVLTLNLKSLYLFCQAVVPIMKQQKSGRIINISSIGGVNPPKHSIHYNSAKAGVLGFTYDLGGTLAPYNINVNAIIPGLIQTDFYNDLAGLSSNEQKTGFFGMLAKSVPLQRIGTPEDIAGAALFLASDLASYVTGTSIMVTGGIHLINKNTL